MYIENWPDTPAVTLLFTGPYVSVRLQIRYQPQTWGTILARLAGILIKFATDQK